MGRAAKLKAARRMAERAARAISPPRADRYAGAKWWQVLLSIFWPAVLNAPRQRVQERLDAITEKAKKTAIKKTSHKLAKG